MIELNINGAPRSVEVESKKPLLWVLREDLNLRGVKYTCGLGLCGACTVLVDGKAVRSCVTSVGSVSDKSVQTIEGLNDPLGLSLKETWCRRRVSQCGYCQTGQIMAAHALISTTDADSAVVAKSLTNLCRCGTYNRVHAAIKEVAEQTRSGE